MTFPITGICIMSRRSISTAEVLRRVLEDTDDDSAEDSGDSVSDQDYVSVAAESPSSNESESEPVVAPVVQRHGRGRGRGQPAQIADQDASENVAGVNTQEMKAKSGRVWSKVAPAVHRWAMIREWCGRWLQRPPLRPDI